MILALLISANLSFVSCKKEAISTKKNIAVVTKTETANFTIEGMSCQVMCANKIEKELTKLDGVQKATIDFAKKSAMVSYDASKTTPEKIVATVEAVAGGEVYKVSNLKSSANKAMLILQDQDKEKKQTRAERRAEKKARKAAKNDAASTTEAPVTETDAKAKSGCCSGKKTCASKPATL